MMATYPIVLAHGTCRFDQLLADTVKDDHRPDATQYFRLIRSTLRDAGFTAEHSSVPWAAGVRTRAAKLKSEVQRILQETGAPKVHIVAHSMGGLDARHMLFEHQPEHMHDQVASLTTIGTPHLGTTFADWGVANSGAVLGLLDLIGINGLDGFRDLTTAACVAFDRQAEAFERGCGVRFATYAGVQPRDRIFAPLQLSWHLIHVHEGDNDGLVSLRSATWRPEYFQKPAIDADHLNELGWWEPDDFALLRWPPAPPRLETPAQLEKRIQALYLQIARGLAAQFPV
jgi:triacylglycerol lipase